MEARADLNNDLLGSVIQSAPIKPEFSVRPQCYGSKVDQALLEFTIHHNGGLCTSNKVVSNLLAIYEQRKKNLLMGKGNWLIPTKFIKNTHFKKPRTFLTILSLPIILGFISILLISDKQQDSVYLTLKFGKSVIFQRDTKLVLITLFKAFRSNKGQQMIHLPVINKIE